MKQSDKSQRSSEVITSLGTETREILRGLDVVFDQQLAELPLIDLVEIPKPDRERIIKYVEECQQPRYASVEIRHLLGVPLEDDDGKETTHEQDNHRE